MSTTPYPRRSVVKVWAGLAIAAATVLIALCGADLLPLPYARQVARPGFPTAVLIALICGASLMLPLAVWVANTGKAPAILRPTIGKLLTTLWLSLLIPGAITESGMPLLLGPLYVFLSVTTPSVAPILGALLYFPIACLLLYPAVSALIWGLQRKTRPAALLGVPVGLYGLLYLMGGSV